MLALHHDKSATYCCGKQRRLLIQSITCRATLALLLATCRPSVTRASRKLIWTASPRHLGGHVPPSACVGICPSIKLLLAAPPPPAPQPQPLISAPTAQRPGRGLNEPLCSAGRLSWILFIYLFIFIQILKPCMSQFPPIILLWSPGRLWISWMCGWGWSHAPHINPGALTYHC